MDSVVAWGAMAPIKAPVHKAKEGMVTAITVAQAMAMETVATITADTNSVLPFFDKL